MHCFVMQTLRNPPLCSSTFHLLGTLLAVTGSIHLGLRLLVNRPPLSQPSPQPSPLQITRTQVTQRLTKTTLRIRHLLSGTVMSIKKIVSDPAFFSSDDT
jgi:hypothetical protein